jgi:hypothetical protein
MEEVLTPIKGIELRTKVDKALWECYKRLFAASEPVGDFEEMVENAEIDEQGTNNIPFDDYEIDHDEMENIMKEVFKEFKLKKYQWNGFRFQILFGCSPRYKKTD